MMIKEQGSAQERVEERQQIFPFQKLIFSFQKEKQIDPTTCLESKQVAKNIRPERQTKARQARLDCL